MTNLILVVKAILAIQALFDQILNLIVESQKSADREELSAAILQAKSAKTKEEKIGAARRISDSFGSNKAAKPKGSDALSGSGTDLHRLPNDNNGSEPK